MEILCRFPPAMAVNFAWLGAPELALSASENMESSENVVLQITDSITTRRSALRIDSPDLLLPVGQLLDKYLKNAPIQRLSEDGRITEDSAARTPPRSGWTM